MNIRRVDTKQLEITRNWKILLFFSFLSAIILFSAGFYYKDLGCDGGWYSYPAFAISQGASPAENMQPIDKIKYREGVRAIFGFKTYPSLRTLYTTFWLKQFPKNILFLKLLSFVELFILAAMGYLLISQFCKERLLALVLFAVFINDKGLTSGAASDFRPDNIVVAFSCLTFACMINSQKSLHMMSAVVASCLMMLVHVTAALPLVFIMCFFVSKNIFAGQYSLKENYKYMFLGVLALIVFFFRNDLLDVLLSAEVSSADNSMVVVDRILISWDKGLTYLLNKELSRWQSYFFTSNVTQLLVFFLGILLLFKQLHRSLYKDPMALALSFSILIGFVFLTFFDPHKEAGHGVPMAPLFFISLSYVLQTDISRGKNVKYILVVLVCLASLSSLALAGKFVIAGERSGYNINSIRKTFTELITRNNHEYLVVGPTELWPFIDPEKSVLILDNTRSRDIFIILKPIINRVDYVVINHDYASYKWKKRFLNSFPDLQLTRIHHVGSTKDFITIYQIKTKLNDRKSL